MSHFTEVRTPGSNFPNTEAPDIELGFEPTEWELENLGATVVEYSFDQGGSSAPVSGAVPVIVATNSLSRRTIRTRARKIWLQDGAGSGSIRVTARTDV